MTRKELNMSIFEGTAEGVLWQPRLETWISHHMEQGTLPNRPVKELLEFTRRVIGMFAPRLILGVSDEISQIGQIEKIEAISELVDKICGLAE